MFDSVHDLFLTLCVSERKLWLTEYLNLKVLLGYTCRGKRSNELSANVQFLLRLYYVHLSSVEKDT